MFGPTKRYPTGEITPHGAYHILHDRIPQLSLRSYDDTVVFNLMGGLAIPDRQAPERVQLRDIRGLVPPWKTIDQKGATQDGTSFVDALYDPTEIELDVTVVGRDPAHLRTVLRDLVGSLDAKRQSHLSFFTHYMGRWWALVRWFKDFDEPVGRIASNVQDLTLRLRIDDAFWQSYPNIAEFRFAYDTDSDTFDYVTAPGDPPTGWTLAYSGTGSGVLYTDGSEAISTLDDDRTVVARRTDFTADSNDMVVDLELGTNSQWYFPPDTYIDLWVRMNNTGTAGTDGIRCRIGYDNMKLSTFTSGVETVLRTVPWTVSGWWWAPSVNRPYPGEWFRLITGTNDNSRMYTVQRNGASIVTVEESTSGTPSLMDADHRKCGFGMAALSGNTVRPLGVQSWYVGDNSQVEQSTFLPRINVGDQPMWDRYTCFGPGYFSFGNGPGSTEMVRFGPLLTNQIMQLRTDPRKRGVVDLTAIPPTQAQLDLYNQARWDFFSFLSFSSVPPEQSVPVSVFGIQPPQGNPYSLIDGRFSVPIPPRSPGDPVQPYYIKATIDGGNADSQIIATGTPLRRIPY